MPCTILQIDGNQYSTSLSKAPTLLLCREYFIFFICSAPFIPIFVFLLITSAPNSFSHLPSSDLCWPLFLHTVVISYQPKSFFPHFYSLIPTTPLPHRTSSICHQVWNESAMSWLWEQRGWEQVVCHRRMILTGQPPKSSAPPRRTKFSSLVTENSAVTQEAWTGWLLITIKPAARAAGGVTRTVGHTCACLIKTVGSIAWAHTHMHTQTQ